MRTTLNNYLLPNLGSDNSSRLNLHQWIQSNRFSSVELVGNCWHLEAYSESELYATFTPDFQRFAFSSFETFSLAGLEVEKCSSTGWPLLKLYYSAFFAAHALTRATGNGHVNLNSKAVKAVNDYIAILGGDDVLSSGSYKVSIREKYSGVFLILEPSSEGSGVHDTFWRYFSAYLDAIATEAVDDALPSASSFVRETSALKSCINEKSNSGVWFSAIRNAINYRHEFDCWLPNDKKSKPRNLNFSSQLGDTDTMEASLNERQDELIRLINLSTYLASLNHQLILRVQGSVGGNADFSRKWRRLNAIMAPK
ncbi:hypothetical protein [Loktanella salsilacus]|uniref:hypothetical protein n=1 Tax=Loktanella salsilacus TaxID=195913 RepID=UPI003704B9A4